MTVINKVNKGIGVEIRGKIGESGDADPRNVLGIYQVRTRSGKHVQVKEAFYTPTNPQTVPQQANRSKFTNAVAAWQALTAPQKAVYNKRAKYKNYSGYNLYISEYMLTP